MYSDLCLTLQLTNLLGLEQLITVTISHLKCFALKSTKLYLKPSTILPSSIWNPVVSTFLLCLSTFCTKGYTRHILVY